MMDGHPEEVGIYELNQDGTVKRIIDTLYYNPKETPATLRAWYPATETSEQFIVAYTVDNPVSPMYAWKEVQDYFHPVTLEFEHWDNKLRVQIEGDTEDAVMKVGVNAIYIATYYPEYGSVMTDSNNVSYIQLKEKGNNVWEGYVAPFSEISSVFVNGEEVRLDNPIETYSGKLYDVTINVNIDKYDYPIDLDTLTDTYRITKPGIYHFTGYNRAGEYIPIVVETPATLLLDNVSLNVIGDKLIYITASGTTTIKLEGTNYTQTNALSSDNQGFILLEGTDTHLLLEGPGELHIENHSSAVIGTPYKPGEEVACGNITIKNVTLHMYSIYSTIAKTGACIGTGKCEAKGSQKHGNITIANSTINCYYNLDSESYAIGTVVDEGLRSDDNGAINIYLKEGETEDDFLNRISGTTYKVNPNAIFHPYEDTPNWLK